MVQLASSNRSALGYVAESSFGVTPANPAIKAMRVTSHGLKPNVETVISGEIRADRQIADAILVGAGASGDIGVELSFNALDDFLEAAMGGTWSNTPTIVNATIDTEISDVSATTLTVASGGAAFVTGMLTWMSGFATAGNNKLARVSSSTGTSIVYPSSTFTVESAQIPVGARVRVVGFEGASGDIVAAASGLTSTTLDFTTLGLSVGEWVKIGGDTVGSQFATAALNGWARISAVAAHVLTFDVLPASWTTDSGTGKTVQVFMGDYLINGTVKRSFTFERQQQDTASTIYELFAGQFVDKLALSFKAKSVITGQISVKGKAAAAGTSRVSGASDVAAPTFDVMNASSNVGQIILNGTAIQSVGPNFVLEGSINIAANGIEAIPVGSLGPIDVVPGEFNVSGSLNTYLGDTTILSQLIANTAIGFQTKLGRADGNRESYVFDLPRIKWSSGGSDVGGKNQLRQTMANYQALRDPTKTYTMSAGRFWYLPAAN